MADIEAIKARARAARQAGEAGAPSTELRPGHQTEGRQLRPAIRPREFILTFGVGGTGKSTGLLQIARCCPQDTFWCLDSELQNFERLLATEFTDLSNVRPIPCAEWEDFVRGIADVSKKMKPDDWIAVDSATQTWDAVQGWFIEQIHGESIDEWFMMKRKQNQQINDSTSKSSEKVKGLGALSGGDGDWQVINKMYFKYIYNALLMAPGHKYVTAEQDKIGDNDDKEVKSAYGPYGVKPKGQKRLGYVPMTSLWLTKRRVDSWGITTIKDRGRAELEDEPISNFAEDYLMKVAGWNYE